MGSLLFPLYINDLPNCLSHAIPETFTDDTHLTVSSSRIKDIETTLNDDLDNIHGQLVSNKLTINIDKID